MTTQRDEQVAIGDEGQMAMTVWIPDADTGPALLLIQEIFGVGPYIRAVAERLADAGYVVGAPDVFWRFAPGWQAGHDEAGLTRRCTRSATSTRARRWATASPPSSTSTSCPNRRPAGVIGYCLGGTLAFGVAIADGPSVCVSYDGSGVPGMVDRLGEVTARRCSTSAPRTRTSPPTVSRPRRRHRRPGRLVLNVEAAGHAFDNHEAPMFYHEAAG